MSEQTSKRAVDPISLTVIWNTLMSIAEELGTTLRSTAFSEGVREGDDFSTAGPADRPGQFQSRASGFHAGLRAACHGAISGRHLAAGRQHSIERQLHVFGALPRLFSGHARVRGRTADRIRCLFRPSGGHGWCRAGFAESSRRDGGVSGRAAHPARAVCPRRRY